MTITKHDKDWYICTWRRGEHVYQGYGTTHARALEDCLRDFYHTKKLKGDHIAERAKELLEDN